MRCYLYYAGTGHEKPIPYRSMAEAREEFLLTARELDRFGQAMTATLHMRDERVHDEPKMAEYPDYVLSLGPRGGLKLETT